MTLFDYIILLVALVVSYFGHISLHITLMIGLAAIIVVRLLRGERTP